MVSIEPVGPDRRWPEWTDLCVVSLGELCTFKGFTIYSAKYYFYLDRMMLPI